MIKIIIFIETRLHGTIDKILRPMLTELTIDYCFGKGYKCANSGGAAGTCLMPIGAYPQNNFQHCFST